MKNYTIYRSIKLIKNIWSKMDLIQVKEKNKFNIKDYLGIIETISKIEYRNISCNYLIEYSELINIGIEVVDHLNNTSNIKNLNNAYISTAIKWAIRNEVRRRWKWYSSRLNKSERSQLLNKEDKTGELLLREAVYKTILSIDEMQENDAKISIVDKEHNPEETIIFREMANAIREAMAILTPREKELIENRFYKEKKLKDISAEFQISQSRVSRIIQTALDKMKAELLTKNIM